jgi:hypothetical protein
MRHFSHIRVHVSQSVEADITAQKGDSGLTPLLTSLHRSKLFVIRHLVGECEKRCRAGSQVVGVACCCLGYHVTQTCYNLIRKLPEGDAGSTRILERIR